MYKLDTGFMGSIIESWIKLAHAGKSFLSKLIYSKEKYTVVKNAFINTVQDPVDSFMCWLKKTQLLLKKDRNLGILDCVARGFVNQQVAQLKEVKEGVLQLNLQPREAKEKKIQNGKVKKLDITVLILGCKEIMAKLLNVKIIMENLDLIVKKYLKNTTGLLLIKKVTHETGNNIYNSVILAI